MQTVQEIVRKTTEYLRGRQIESARLDAELLVADALGWDRLTVFTRFDYPLTDEQLHQCRERVRRRASGEPVAYILGYKDFYMHRFAVNSETLIPRPDSEVLVDTAIGRLRTERSNVAEGNSRLRIADFGCGTGCLGISIVLGLAVDAQLEVELELIDVSKGALDIAQTNSKSIIADEVRIQSRCVQLDLDQAEVPLATAAYDLIVANPPYIAEDDPRTQKSVRDFEPFRALFSDQSGFGAHRRWMAHAHRLLKPGGWTYFEMGEGQADSLAQEAQAIGFSKVATVPDLSGIARVLEAQKEG